MWNQFRQRKVRLRQSQKRLSKHKKARYFYRAFLLQEFCFKCVNTYETLSLIGIWFTGIATMSASGVALFLALRSDKIMLKLNVGLRLLIQDRRSENVVWIQVTNIRTRMATISAAFWRFQRSNGTYTFIVLTPANIRNSLPATLADGQSVDLILNYEWLDNVSRDIGNQMNREELNVALQTLIVGVQISSGLKFTEKPEKEIIDRIYEVATNSNPSLSS